MTPRVGARPRPRQRSLAPDDGRADQHWRYGMSPVRVAMLRQAQGDRCGICLLPLNGGGVIEHDHVIAETLGIVDERSVRGLTCVSCNNGMGAFHDDPALLRRAADWVERRRAEVRR